MSTTHPGSSDPAEQLTRAFEADDADRVRELLQGHPGLRARIDDPDGPFDSPAVVRARSRAMLDALLDAGADLNAKSRWWAGGFGILHGASPDVARYAVERGALVDAHAAARLGMTEKLAELVAANPEVVHERGPDGMTPLHLAADVETAAFLLDRGARIDARDVDHESTPAQYMLDNRQDVARYLVSRGCATDLLMAAALGDGGLARKHLDADPGCIRMRVSDEFFPKADPRSGGTIYQWTLGFFLSPHRVARKFGRGDVLELLESRTPPPLKLIEACWAGDEAKARALLAAEPGLVKGLPESDLREVADAARNNDAAAVRLMLECGFPATARGQHGATPLHWAAFHGNAEMARIVLRSRPDLEATDSDFKGTPLGWASHGSENGWHSRTGDYAGTVEALLAAGAKPPAKLQGSPAVREILRRHGVSDEA
ncbi:Ankyrin repeats (3 copies) [Aquisphaera giovannonii]|uniref:Ankyrin repeats (3 copies) n=1 Tax=Aquisphaera giovannonii TaxID=406548 RepID=A0A5B9WCU9_9BACT|nr:ankyrin repeat domain-containing protein [Aquisphaera giovannonii]QEH38402.1 Ankyrin repeats (3 copies) [Aquisphaera giovannonii]